MDHNEFKFKKFSVARCSNMNVSNTSEEETSWVQISEEECHLWIFDWNAMRKSGKTKTLFYFKWNSIKICCRNDLQIKTALKIRRRLKCDLKECQVWMDDDISDSNCRGIRHHVWPSDRSLSGSKIFSHWNVQTGIISPEWRNPRCVAAGTESHLQYSNTWEGRKGQ
jgi:hypothetical protein